MTLDRRHIVVTRAPHQAEPLVAMLRDYGARPVLYPTIAIALPDDMALLGDALDSFDRYDWVVLTSPNTAMMLRNFAVNWSGVKVAVVGETTADAAARYLNAAADFRPPLQTGASLAETLPLSGGEMVFLPQSELADDTLADGLATRGATVDAIAAYRNVLGTGGADLPALLKAGDIDALTFTSGSTVTNLTKRLERTPTTVPAACIGPSTADAARDAGYETVLVPSSDYSLTGMLDVLAAHFNDE